MGFAGFVVHVPIFWRVCFTRDIVQVPCSDTYAFEQHIHAALGAKTRDWTHGKLPGFPYHYGIDAVGGWWVYYSMVVLETRTFAHLSCITLNWPSQTRDGNRSGAVLELCLLLYDLASGLRYAL